MSFILNKKNYPNIKLNGGGDMCDPTLNGVLLDSNNVPVVNIPFWNYDSSFKSKKLLLKIELDLREHGTTILKTMEKEEETHQS